MEREGVSERQYVEGEEGGKKKPGEEATGWQREGSGWQTHAHTHAIQSGGEGNEGTERDIHTDIFNYTCTRAAGVEEVSLRSQRRDRMTNVSPAKIVVVNVVFFGSSVHWMGLCIVHSSTTVD